MHNVRYLIVAGGGGGAGDNGGGGGGGGGLQNPQLLLTGYPVTVGTGGKGTWSLMQDTPGQVV